MNHYFSTVPEYDQIKLHSGANDLVVEKLRETEITCHQSVLSAMHNSEDND